MDAQRLVKMDLLDYLFSNEGIFNRLNPASKKKFFNSRPVPPLDVILDTVGNKHFVTLFDQKYYNEFNWMTACPKRKVLICFVCLLQGDTIESVICPRSNIVMAAQAHEMTSSHMTCYEACLRSIAAAETIHDRSVVKMKKTALKKLTQTLFLLKCQTYFDKVHKEHEFSKEMIHFFAVNDVNFDSNWETHLPNVPNREMTLLTQLRHAVVDRIKHELSTTDFVSLQIEDVSEFLPKPTISVTLRFISADRVVERFAGFYELSKSNCKIDDSNLVDILNYWDVKDKVIGISCDFDANRIPSYVLDRPFKLFNITSEHYNLNYIFIKIASIDEKVKEFLGVVRDFVNFLSDPIHNHFQTENDISSISPNLPEELTDPDRPINEHVSAIYKNHTKLCDYLYQLKKHPNASLIRFSVENFEKKLKDPPFIATASIFQQIFQFEDQMETTLRSFHPEVNTTLQISSKIRDIASNSEANSMTAEVVSSLLNDFLTRSKIHNHFAIGQLFHLNHTRPESNNINTQLRTILDDVLKETKGLLDFNLPRLKVELQTIFKDPSKNIPPLELFEFFVKTGLPVVYPELTRLLRFYVTLPISYKKRRTDHKTTYRKIKSFARVTHGSGPLFPLDYLLIETDLSIELLGDQEVMCYFIEEYAKTHDLRELL